MNMPSRCRIAPALGALLVLASPRYALTTPECQEVEKGFAFFDTKRSAWIESETIHVLQCSDHVELALTSGVSNKELHRVRVAAPAKGQAWSLDGCSCNEAGPSRKAARNKVVLSAVVVTGEALRPSDVWAVDPVRMVFERLKASGIRCHLDEP